MEGQGRGRIRRAGAGREGLSRVAAKRRAPRRTTSAFNGSAMPNSLSSPRMRLMLAVRCSTKPWCARCAISLDCCSSVLIGLRRMLGRCTASQIAAASAASFLLRLPLMRQGVMSLRAIRRTSRPRACKLARPVVRAGAGFDADRARRPRRDQGVESGSRQLGLAQLHSACLTDAVHG